MSTEFKDLHEAVNFIKTALQRNWKEARIVEIEGGYRVTCKG